MIIKKVDIWPLNCKFRYPFKHKLRKIALYAIIASHKRLGSHGRPLPYDRLFFHAILSCKAFEPLS
jgi:hypothetical protein